MTDTEIIEWMERNPLAITATAVIKSWGRKNWWQTAYGDHDTLREAVERCHKENPSS